MKRSSFLVLLFSILATLAGVSAKAADPVVVMSTSMGDITIQLDPKDAPKTVANFLAYVDAKAYDGTIFHRVIPGFVAQGGGFKPDMTEISYMPPVVNEASNGLKNLRGTISMARTNDPNSATSQFFLNFVDNTATGQRADGTPNTNLDPGGVSPEGYAVFGKIIKGMSVLDKIAQVQTSTVGQFQDVPATTITIISVRRQ